MDNKDVYQDIAERILSEVAAIQVVELFFNQFDASNENGQVVTAESVLLEFGAAQADELSGRQYAIKVPLTCYTCVAEANRTSLHRRQGESTFGSTGFDAFTRSAAVRAAILDFWGTANTVKEIRFTGSDTPFKAGGLDVIATRYEVLYYQAGA